MHGFPPNILLERVSKDLAASEGADVPSSVFSKRRNCLLLLSFTTFESCLGTLWELVGDVFFSLALFSL